MNSFFQEFLAGPLIALVILALALLVALVLMVRRYRTACLDRDHLREITLTQEHQLKQAQRMEAVGILAGSIVHNLNNLLAVILGHARMNYRKSTNDSAENEDLGQIIKAGTMASELVQEISNFYRQADQARKPTDLVPLVRDTLKFLRDILPPNVVILEDLDPNCGLVLATPTGVQQVLMNLCNNSLQAMYRDHGEIKVTLRSEKVTGWHRAIPQDLEPGSYAKLTVRDNGRGLSEEALGRIFDSYFSDSEVGSGMGIGLSTVYRILKDHEGASIPQSRVGHGASFDIYFPLIAWSVSEDTVQEDISQVLSLTQNKDQPKTIDQEEEQDSSLESIPGIVSPGKTGQGQRGNVLLVDDEKMVSQVMFSGLTSQGFRVTVHTDARLALAEFAESPDGYDIVVTDQIMPHMSGIRLTKKIHGIRPHTPVILMTGFRDSFNEAQAKEAGIQSFILKPFSHRDLANLLDRTLLRRMKGTQ
ncbi:MAG: response regulator [Gemmatimonadales bacterium]|nr:response regulator [Gemmatimonadales bacterium]